MALSAHLLSSTLGLLMPRFRTLGQWAETYRKIIAGKPIEEKTKANRLCILGHVLTGLGEDQIISAVKPHEISGLVMKVHKIHPSLAKRILIEAKDFFSEAVNYSWLLRSPAAAIKYPKVKVLRERLTLDQWVKIHAWSAANQPPWVSRMLVLALVTGQRRSDVEKFRFADVWSGHLHIVQAKTGERLALPLDLRLEAINMTIGMAIENCRGYAINDDYLVRKHNGQPLVMASLSARFEEAREGALPPFKSGHPPSLHETRSLSERLYRKQGINTMVLLGHKHQAMTDMYNDDRGLSSGEWRTLSL